MFKLFLFTFTCLIISNNSFAYCKINQFGHNLCTGEKALYVIDEEATDKSSANLIKNYKPVTIEYLHAHEPIAVIFVNGLKLKTIEVHVDKLLGNKLCKDSDFCHGQKVIIKDECRSEDDKKSYRVSKVYEDRQLNEDIIEVTRGRFIFKKTKVYNQRCIQEKD